MRTASCTVCAAERGVRTVSILGVSVRTRPQRRRTEAVEVERVNQSCETWLSLRFSTSARRVWPAPSSSSLQLALICRWPWLSLCKLTD